MEKLPQDGCAWLEIPETRHITASGNHFLTGPG